MGNNLSEAGLLVGTSVIGPKHVKKNVPNEDSWDAARTDRGRQVIAVADGLGSADLAHKGANTATKVAVNTLRENIDSVEKLASDAAEEPIKNAITSARSSVAEKAKQLDQSPSELNTTLLVAAAGPTGTAGAVVGDGGIICDVGEDYSLLVPHEESILDLGASHITVPIMEDNWENSYRFGTVEYCEGVAVFSDGFEKFTWRGTDANPEFFDSIFALVRDHSNADNASETMSEIFNDPPYSRDGDDKTIVVGDLPHDFEDEEIVTEKGEKLTVDEIKKQQNRSCICHIEESNSDALKLYSPAKRSEDGLEEKIRTMIENPPEKLLNTNGGSRCAWPTEIVESADNNQFIGYRFPLYGTDLQTNILDAADSPPVRNKETVSLVSFLKKIIPGLKVGNNNQKNNPYEVALNTAKIVAAVHKNGYAFGYFHPEMFITDGANVYWQNCEQIHVDSQGDVSERGSPALSYNPPEETDDNIENVQQSDLFGLGILIFQLLMEGHHPYAGEGAAASNGSPDKMIRVNQFPYRDKQMDELRPPKEAPSYTDLPQEVRRLFGRCFIEGKSHPKIRPTANDWIETIESVPT